MTEPPDKRLAPDQSAAAGTVRATIAVAFVLGVFAAVVAAAGAFVAHEARRQTLDREGEVLQAVAAMQRAVIEETAAEWGLPMDDAALDVALNTSKLRGVVAVRLFDANGRFQDAVPAEVAEANLAPEIAAEALRGRPVVRFHPSHAVGSLVLNQADSARLPLVEADIALPQPAEPPVVVQYWIDGTAMAAEFARIDRRVALQAGLALLGGGALAAGTLLWAFRRLAQANRLLRARAGDLAAANRELSRLARTAAIGAITAHLVHGLRNPIAGLEGFVASRATGGEPGADDRASALESTRRLRRLMEEVLAVLHDVRDEASFETPAAEMLASVRERLDAQARAKGVRLETREGSGAALGARAAGMGALVLANLGQNAIEASPAGAAVRIETERSNDGVVFSVTDEGPGFPAEAAADPFQPRRSAKPGGAGIGLAISRQLALHAGGELTLARSDARGSVLRLRLPAAGSPARGGAP